MTRPAHLPDDRRNLGPVPNIQAQCITAQAFAPYGDLLVAPTDVGRADFVAKFENHRPHARTNIALVRCNSVAARLKVDEMECHSFSSQTFFPLDVGGYLVVVARDDGEGRPEMSTLAAFRVSHPLGINYHPGTWHIGMIALSRPGTFALLIHEDGSADDCRYCPVEPFNVLVESHASPTDY